MITRPYCQSNLLSKISIVTGGEGGGSGEKIYSQTVLHITSNILD
jgi:hypothetical protein